MGKGKFHKYWKVTLCVNMDLPFVSFKFICISQQVNGFGFIHINYRNMKLIIKNMVCPRCIIVVRQILSAQDIVPKEVQLGEIELYNTLTETQLEALDTELQQFGFEILQEESRQVVEKIKQLIIQKVQGSAIPQHFSMSSYLKSETLKDYSTLTKIFSCVEGCTIEKFFILQKVEKAKELLRYKQMSSKQISLVLGYSSCQHLSMQFKKVVKLSPTVFQKQKLNQRKPIDNVVL